jgi:hypothetical protein
MENNLIQADIFFFITSTAVILVSVLVIVVLAYLVLILKDFRGVSAKVKEETDLIAMDINEARAYFRSEGAGMKSGFNFLKKMVGSIFGVSVKTKTRQKK